MRGLVLDFTQAFRQRLVLLGGLLQLLNLRQQLFLLLLNFLELCLLLRCQLAALLLARGLFREVGAQQRDGMAEL